MQRFVISLIALLCFSACSSPIPYSWTGEPNKQQLADSPLDMPEAVNNDDASWPNLSRVPAKPVASYTKQERDRIIDKLVNENKRR